MFTKLDIRKPKRELYRELALIGEAASHNAYAPFSDYRVGAVTMLWDGSVYLGINVEDPSIGLTIHGESSSINAAITDGGLKRAEAAGLNRYNFIKAVAILPQRMFFGWPCGHCADFMSGFGQDLDIVVRTDDEDVAWRPLKHVVPRLPDARRALEFTESRELLRLIQDPSKQGLALPPSLIPTSGVPLGRAYRQLLAIAKEAAQRSYAPYTKRPAGAAVWLWDGSVYAGTRSENVGYSGSDHPEQVATGAALTDGALVRAIAAGLGPQQFVRAVAYAPLGQPDTWPTGSSRQSLCDFGLDMDVIIESAAGRPRSRTLRQLFPQAFAADVLDYWV